MAATTTPTSTPPALATGVTAVTPTSSRATVEGVEMAVTLKPQVRTHLPAPEVLEELVARAVAGAQAVGAAARSREGAVRQGTGAPEVREGSASPEARGLLAE